MEQQAGFVPALGDWDLPHGLVTPGDQVRRTKSRAYQCCVWMGYAGLHNFFLGRYLRAVLQTCAGGGCMAVMARLLFGFSWRRVGLAMILLVVDLVWWKVDATRLARAADDDPAFASLTPRGYYFFFHVGMMSPLWGTNYWGEAAIRRFEEVYPDGLQPRLVNTEADAGASAWCIWE